MSNLRNGSCHVTNICFCVLRGFMSILRNGHVAVSILGVQGPEHEGLALVDTERNIEASCRF